MTGSVSKKSEVKEVSRCVDELLSVLREEFSLMKANSADSLGGLIARKEQLIQSIAQREPTLHLVFEQLGSDPTVQELRERIKQCSELNQRNKELANVQLTYTRKSLELLRSTLKLNDVPVYGATGEISVSREKRHFGSA